MFRYQTSPMGSAKPLTNERRRYGYDEDDDDQEDKERAKKNLNPVTMDPKKIAAEKKIEAFIENFLEQISDDRFFMALAKEWALDEDKQRKEFEEMVKFTQENDLGDINMDEFPKDEE